MSSFRSLAAAALLAVAAPVQAQSAPDAAPRLVLNVPAGRLDLFRGAEHVRAYPVSVGTPAHPTPVGRYELRHAVWNPDWTPPDAAWARSRRRTAPGPRNPMGRVKLQLSGEYYIHGTVAENERLLGTPASHGCVRMSNRDVMELARLLHGHASPGVTGQELDRIAAESSRTRRVAFSRPVPVEISYRVAEVRDGALTVHRDVYGRARGLDAEVRVALLAAGVDPFPVDAGALAAAQAEARWSGRATVALAGTLRRREPALAPAGLAWEARRVRTAALPPAPRVPAERPGGRAAGL